MCVHLQLPNALIVIIMRIVMMIRICMIIIIMMVMLINIDMIVLMMIKMTMKMMVIVEMSESGENSVNQARNTVAWQSISIIEQCTTL